MAEEGVTGGGGAQSINVGVKVENQNAAEAIKALTKHVEALKKEFQGTAAESGKAGDKTIEWNKVAFEGNRRVREEAKGVASAFGDIGASIGSTIASVISFSAVTAQAFKAARADMDALKAGAADLGAQRQSYAQAGLGISGVAPTLQAALRGTAFGGAEGAALVAQATQNVPVEVLKNRTGEVANMFKMAQGVAGAYGADANGLPTGSAGLVSAGAMVLDKMGGSTTGAQAIKFGALLGSQGLRNVEEANILASKLILAGMDPEKALLFATYTQEQDVTGKKSAGLTKFFDGTDEESRGQAALALRGHKGPLTRDQQTSVMDAPHRLEYLRQHPSDDLGKLWAGFNNGEGMKGMDQADAYWRSKQAEIASTPYFAQTQATVDQRAKEQKLGVSNQRDNFLYEAYKRKIALKYDEARNPTGREIALKEYYARYVASGDPVMAAMETAPDLGGVTSSNISLASFGDGQSKTNLEMRALRSYYLDKSGLSSAAGEGGQHLRLTVVAGKGYRVVPQSEPSVGGGS